jgi:hypothetical protein
MQKPYGTYGAMPSKTGFVTSLAGGDPTKPLHGGQKRHFNLAAILISLFVPWVLFMALTSSLSFQVHYDSPTVCNLVVILTFGLVILFGYFAYAAIRRNLTGQNPPNWYVFLFITSIIAWFAGYVVGNMNYANNMQPYYDVNNLNVYPSVDPSTTKGQQLMDMGQAIFTTSSRLDLTKSVGFKNLDVYCVAPVVSPNSTMETYDFWAVGINCCSGHAADFACGEFNNPLAHSGLRLMRDDLRPYFRLAVEQAAASNNIKATHPVFLYWMQDPTAEINSYQDAGMKEFLTGATRFFAAQVVLVMIGVVLFTQLEPM